VFLHERSKTDSRYGGPPLFLVWFSLRKSNFAEVGYCPAISSSGNRKITSNPTASGFRYGFNFGIRVKICSALFVCCPRLKIVPSCYLRMRLGRKDLCGTVETRWKICPLETRTGQSERY
jgi:hypothetical protein